MAAGLKSYRRKVYVALKPGVSKADIEARAYTDYRPHATFFGVLDNQTGLIKNWLEPGNNGYTLAELLSLGYYDTNVGETMTVITRRDGVKKEYDVICFFRQYPPVRYKIYKSGVYVGEADGYACTTGNKVSRRIKNPRKLLDCLGFSVILGERYCHCKDYDNYLIDIAKVQHGGMYLNNVSVEDLIGGMKARYRCVEKLVDGKANLYRLDVDEDSRQEAEDYFVINKKSTLKIRSNQSTVDESNILKEVAPGKAVKAVKPIEEVQKDGIQWIKVYVDENKTEIGWANRDNIYPDKPIETIFSGDYSQVKGTFDGKVKTLDYISIWGRPGQGKYDKGEQKQNGRFKVAVGPRILYPEYPDDGKLEDDDFNAFNKNITVYLKHKNQGPDLKVPCIVTDLKAHSYNKYPDGHNNTVLPSETTGKVELPSGGYVPNGLIQTGIAYPCSSNAKKDLACSMDHMNGTIVEFCGWEVKEFTCSDYYLDKIVSNEEKHGN